MLLGDTAILQDSTGKIFRPSDVGELVEIANSWTLKFSNGAVITTTESTNIKTYNKSMKTYNWTNLNNLTSSHNLGVRELINFPKKKWKSKVDLSEYTSTGNGTFDIGDLRFAKFAGLFIRGLWKTKVDRYVFFKSAIEESFDYVCSLGLKSTLPDKKESHVYLKKSYLTELVDSLFDYTGVPSIPDEIIFNAGQEWVDSFLDGFTESCLCYGKPKVYEYFIANEGNITADLGILLNKSSRVVEFAINRGTHMVIKFPKNMFMLRILDGYENEYPLPLYDIGDGEFNVSGIRMMS